MAVYVSTTCLVNGSNVFDVLETYAEAGLKNIELGSTHDHINQLSPARFKRYGFNFFCHHYFPPPEESFIVNLASQDPVILKRSREQVKRSIEFCYNLGIKLFTFHAGFRADPDLNFRFSQQQPVISYEKVFTTFVESLEEVNSYAQERGVRIAIENNVLSEYNVVDGQNKFLLFCEAEEFENLWQRIPSANVGILLDLGHLKVTSRWLGFNRYEFINKVKDKIFVIHIHENDGLVDQHRELDEESWCLKVIKERSLTHLPIVLEAINLDISQILRNVRLIRRFLCFLEDTEVMMGVQPLD